ncbi:MAG TPA: hypothetical protein DCX80_07280 [Chloroflexi bacterium]|mgnify:FL=1|nr:hypothetical protein [Chloroflexota bacterium]
MPAVIISVLALLFSVSSFWWMYWRRGNLHVGPPRSYGAYASADRQMVLYLPLVFYNDGPIPIMIQNLRLTFINEAPDRPLGFVATIHKLISSDDRRLAVQFPVRGREALSLICEFQRRPAPFLFQEGSYWIRLEAQLWGKRKRDAYWEDLVTFELNISAQAATQAPEVAVAYDNLRETLERNLST